MFCTTNSSLCVIFLLWKLISLVLMVAKFEILQNVRPILALLKYDHEFKVSDSLVSKREIPEYTTLCVGAS